MIALEENNFDTLKELANQVGLDIDIVLKRTNTVLNDYLLYEFRRK